MAGGEEEEGSKGLPAGLPGQGPRERGKGLCGLKRRVGAQFGPPSDAYIFTYSLHIVLHAILSLKTFAAELPHIIVHWKRGCVTEVGGRSVYHGELKECPKIELFLITKVVYGSGNSFYL